jgi:hypothetical protein
VLADKEIIMAALNIKSMDFGANFVKVKGLIFSYLQLTSLLFDSHQLLLTLAWPSSNLRFFIIALKQHNNLASQLSY